MSSLLKNVPSLPVKRNRSTQTQTMCWRLVQIGTPGSYRMQLCVQENGLLSDLAPIFRAALLTFQDDKLTRHCLIQSTCFPLPQQRRTRQRKQHYICFFLASSLFIVHGCRLATPARKFGQTCRGSTVFKSMVHLTDSYERWECFIVAGSVTTHWLFILFLKIPRSL